MLGKSGLSTAVKAVLGVLIVTCVIAFVGLLLFRWLKKRHRKRKRKAAKNKTCENGDAGDLQEMEPIPEPVQEFNKLM